MTEEDDYLFEEESDEDKEDRLWGESFMDEMEDVNPGWVSGDESD